MICALALVALRTTIPIPNGGSVPRVAALAACRLAPAGRAPAGAAGLGRNDSVLAAWPLRTRRLLQRGPISPLSAGVHAQRELMARGRVPWRGGAGLAR